MVARAKAGLGGGTGVRKACSCVSWGEYSIYRLPAGSSLGGARPQMHFGHEQAVRMHVTGVSFVSFNAQT